MWLGGILLLGILGGGAVAAAVLLWENVDIRQLAPELAEAPPSPPMPAPPTHEIGIAGPFAVALFESPRNGAYFPDSSFYPDALRAWAEAAEEIGGEVTRIRGARAIQELPPSIALLVPEAPCLSAAEMSAVAGHLRSGGGVLTNWAVGARNERCAWRGWQFVRSLTAARDIRELPARDALFLTIPGGAPLSTGMDPGTRVELRPDPSLAARRSGPRIFWSDWALNPRPDETGGGADAAVVARRTSEGGRLAWLGLRLDQAATPRDSVHLRRLVQNGLRFAAGRPWAAPAPWPRGHRAALVVVVDVESEADNAVPVAQLLEEAGVPGSFYAVSGLVEGRGEMATALSAAGEVGSQTTDHTPLAGLTAEDQTTRLRRSHREIERWTGLAPSGLRPPEETFDEETVAAWARAGGRYLVALNEGRSASPEIHSHAGEEVVLVPRLMKDDYNVFVQEGAVRSVRLAEAWLEGARKLRGLEGVAVVAGRTQILSTPGRREALRTVLDSVRAQGDWWLARGEDVADWWRARQDIRIAFVEPELDEALDEAAPRLLDLDLLVDAPTAEAPVEGAWLDLAVPDLPWDAVPWVDGSPSDYAVTEDGIRVPLGTLGGGRSRRIVLRRALGATEEVGSPGGGA